NELRILKAHRLRRRPTLRAAGKMCIEPVRVLRRQFTVDSGGNQFNCFFALHGSSPGVLVGADLCVRPLYPLSLRERVGVRENYERSHFRKTQGGHGSPPLQAPFISPRPPDIVSPAVFAALLSAACSPSPVIPPTASRSAYRNNPRNKTASTPDGRGVA